MRIWAAQIPGDKTTPNSFQVAVIGMPFDYATGEVKKRSASAEFSALSMQYWHRKPLPEPYRRDRYENNCIYR